MGPYKTRVELCCLYLILCKEVSQKNSAIRLHFFISTSCSRVKRVTIWGILVKSITFHLVKISTLPTVPFHQVLPRNGNLSTHPDSWTSRGIRQMGRKEEHVDGGKSKEWDYEICGWGEERGAEARDVSVSTLAIWWTEREVWVAGISVGPWKQKEGSCESQTFVGKQVLLCLVRKAQTKYPKTSGNQYNCRLYLTYLFWVYYICPVCLCVRFSLLVCFAQKQRQWNGFACLSVSRNQQLRKCIKRKDFLNLRKKISTTPYGRRFRNLLPRTYWHSMTPLPGGHFRKAVVLLFLWPMAPFKITARLCKIGKYNYRSLKSISFTLYGCRTNSV